MNGVGWGSIMSTCVCLGVCVNIPEWWEVRTPSSALPSSMMLSFRALWPSTLSLKLCNTHRHTWTQKSSVCSSEEQKNDTLTGEEVIYIPGLCESIDKKQTNHSESWQVLHTLMSSTCMICQRERQQTGNSGLRRRTIRRSLMWRSSVNIFFPLKKKSNKGK